MFRLYNIHPVKAKSNSDVILLLNISGIGNEIVIYKTKDTNKRKKGAIHSIFNYVNVLK